MMAIKPVLFCTVLVGLFLTASTLSAFAQSQALNGQIEGTVLDQNNAVVANSAVTVTNIETGANRTAQLFKLHGSFRRPGNHLQINFPEFFRAG